ncbi:MAG: amidohydrolase family protein [Chloroflexota bacterium]
MIIDLHHHFLPREAFDALGGQQLMNSRYNDGKTMEFVFYHKLYEIDTQLLDMDEAGIDVSVFGMAQWNLKGLKICRAVNDGMARVVREHPDRIMACAQVPVVDGEAAVPEIYRGIQELGLHAVALLSSNLDITLSDRRMFPIYEAVQKLKVPIVIHPSLLPLGAESEYSIGRTLARAYDVSKAALRIMYEVSKRYPDLTFIMPHFGGVLPFMKGRINGFFEPPTELGIEFPEEIAALHKTPREREEFGIVEPFERLFDLLYLDLAGHGGYMPTLHCALETVRHDRLVFGTDYPMEIHNGLDMKIYIDNVRQLGLPKQEIDGILGNTAAKLFGLKVSA